MKNLLVTTILILFAEILLGQKNEINLFLSFGTGGRANDSHTIGLGYYRELVPKIKVGIIGEIPLVRNTVKHSFVESNTLNTLAYSYSDDIKVLNIDLLVKTPLLQRNLYSLNLVGGITYQNYNVTYIPFIEIKDYKIVSATEVNTNKGFILPKIGINFDLKLYKSIYLSGLLFARTSFLLKSGIIYSYERISSTSDNTASGKSYGMVNVEEQIGFNFGLSYKF